MKEIVKKDPHRKATITLMLNDEDDVIGVRIEPDLPIPLYEFSIERLLLTPRIPPFAGGPARPPQRG